MKKWYEMKAKGAQKGEISIYDEIGLWGISAKDFTTDLKALGDIKVLDVHINSPGGSVTDGIAIYNSLKQHAARVNVHIDGIALSMGSVIAMAGDFIYMAENALFMIHNPWGGAMGDADELRKTADVMDKMKNSLIISYKTKTGMEESDISALMDAETWMSAAEALELGFIDEVSAEMDIAASFDMGKFDYKNMPQNFDKEGNAAILSSDDTLLDKAAGNFLAKELAAANKTNEDIPMLTEEEIKAAADKAEAEIKAAADKAVVDFKAQDAVRKTAILNAFSVHAGHEKLLQECISDSEVTVECATTKLLAAIGSSAKPAATSDVRIETLADSRDKFRAGAAEAIAIRNGSQADDGKNEFRSSTLLDLAKQSLRVSNVPVNGMDKMQVVAAAFTHSSSDFPYLLENSLGKELRNAYGEFAETWSQWCDVGSVPDFKQNSRIQLGSFNNLDTIPEGGEYTAGTFGEDKAVIQAETKGKMISLTRQMIINDDLGGFMRIARMMGRAAARTVGSDVYTLLKANALMFDGLAMFVAGHNNLPSGAAPTAATLGAARTLMRKQKDVDSNDFLNIQPAYIICGVELEDTLNVLLASETDPSKTNSKIPNPVRNMAQLITDPRLGATEWYMVANPSEAPLIEVAFLDGNQTPYLESQNGFTSDGTMWKVRMDYGMSGIDFRGGVKGNA